MALGLFNQGSVPHKGSLAASAGLTLFSSRQKDFSETATASNFEEARKNVESTPVGPSFRDQTPRSPEKFGEAILSKSAGLLFLGGSKYSSSADKQVAALSKGVDALDLAVPRMGSR